MQRAGCARCGRQKQGPGPASGMGASHTRKNLSASLCAGVPTKGAARREIPPASPFWESPVKEGGEHPMKKRLIALLLSLCMLLGMAPLSALASGESYVALGDSISRGYGLDPEKADQSFVEQIEQEQELSLTMLAAERRDHGQPAGKAGKCRRRGRQGPRDGRRRHPHHRRQRFHERALRVYG